MDKPSPDAMAYFSLMRAEMAAYTASLPQIRADGEAALRRLLPIAQSDTGQSRRVAGFLLGLYNGSRFPFDLTDLRALDLGVFRDCMAVLAMDFNLEKEVHKHFENGSAIWERLAATWMGG